MPICPAAPMTRVFCRSIMPHTCFSPVPQPAGFTALVYAVRRNGVKLVPVCLGQPVPIPHTSMGSHSLLRAFMGRQASACRVREFATRRQSEARISLRRARPHDPTVRDTFSVSLPCESDPVQAFRTPHRRCRATSRSSVPNDFAMTVAGTARKKRNNGEVPSCCGRTVWPNLVLPCRQRHFGNCRFHASEANTVRLNPDRPSAASAGGSRDNVATRPIREGDDDQVRSAQLSSSKSRRKAASASHRPASVSRTDFALLTGFEIIPF